MNMNRLLSLVGIARRAGRISWGRDAVEESLRKKKAHLVLVAADLSPKTTAGGRFSAERARVPLVAIRETIESVSQAIGKKAGIVAVLDEGFAKKLAALAAEEAAGNAEKGREPYDD